MISPHTYVLSVKMKNAFEYYTRAVIFITYIVCMITSSPLNGDSDIVLSWTCKFLRLIKMNAEYVFGFQSLATLANLRNNIFVCFALLFIRVCIQQVMSYIYVAAGMNIRTTLITCVKLIYAICVCNMDGTLFEISTITILVIDSKNGLKRYALR